VSAPTYEIRTVNDFLQVPPERWDACLEEFKACLALAAVSRAVLPQTTLGVYRWVDDGERNVEASVTVQSKDEVGGKGTP
jgi:hypothetical protein